MATALVKEPRQQRQSCHCRTLLKGTGGEKGPELSPSLASFSQLLTLRRLCGSRGSSEGRHAVRSSGSEHPTQDVGWMCQILSPWLCLGYMYILSASKIQAFQTSNKELKLLKHLLLLQPEGPHGARWANSPDQYSWFAKLLLRLSKLQSFHHALLCCWQSCPACWECCWKAIFLILTLSSPFQILYCPSSYLIQNKLLPFCFRRPLWCFFSYLP